MKTLINVFSLVLCFTFLASTAANAQSGIRNMTDCEFVVAVEYGDVANCSVVDRIEVIVQPMSTTILPIPNNTGIITAKGAYDNNLVVNCPFLVGAANCGYPTSDSVTCSIECGDYTAVLSSGSIMIF